MQRVGIVLLVITIIVFVCLGGAAVFGWLKIPGLSSEIEDLKAEIDRLSAERDRLKSGIDRYESLNDQLTHTVIDLKDTTITLNSTITELNSNLNEATDQLNMTNQDIRSRVAELADRNEQYAQLNNNLTASKLQLERHTKDLEDAVQDLVIERHVLSNLNLELGNLTLYQNKTLIEIQKASTSLTVENDRLESLNYNITSAVAFLNETSLGFETSLEVVTGDLVEQIVANQVLLVKNLENVYHQRIANWGCDYRDVFRELDWGKNYSLPITDWDSAITYLDGRVFNEMCWEVSDFEVYMNTKYPDGSITSHMLVDGVNAYVSSGLEYYFSERDEGGITTEAWSNASFSCKNLAKKIFWRSVI